MTTHEILEAQSHRPWALPKGRWHFYQEWNNAVFLHWQVECEELKKYLPDSLEIDLYEGKAWVSLVAFTMEKVRPRNLPAVGGISNFDEINIRTYVKRDNKLGVYFLSIEAGNAVAAMVAKTISGLPYRYSNMARLLTGFRSINPQYEDHFNIEFKIKDPLIEKTALDVWLTERYALYQDSSTELNRFEIHHAEWPILNIEIEKLNVYYPRFNSLIGGKPTRQHYSEGVQVLAWGKNRLGK